MEKLETKLKQLNLGVLRTKNNLDSGKRESIKRHLDALRKTVQESNEFKLAAEAAKIELGETHEKINDWNNETDAKIELADVEINLLENWLAEKERSEHLVAQEEQLTVELKLHEKRMKRKAELELSKTAPEVQECTGFKTVKLPKLVISKFEGSIMDWPRFWGQFDEAIEI